MVSYIDISGTAFVEKLKALQPQQSLPTYSGLHTIENINDFVNGFKYIKEKTGDKWKTPDEFFKDGGGDCEDFSVVKFHYLKPAHHVQILVCHSIAENLDHAVLLVDGKYILDNRNSLIKNYDDFLIYYSVYYRADENGIQVGAK